MDPLSITSSLVGILNTTRQIQRAFKYNEHKPEKVKELTDETTQLGVISEILVRLLQDYPGVLNDDSDVPRSTLEQANRVLLQIEDRLVKKKDAPLLQGVRWNVESDTERVRTLQSAFRKIIRGIEIDSIFKSPDVLEYRVRLRDTPSVLSINSLTSEDEPGPQATDTARESEWLKGLKPRYARFLEKILFVPATNHEIILPKVRAGHTNDTTRQRPNMVPEPERHIDHRLEDTNVSHPDGQVAETVTQRRHSNENEFNVVETNVTLPESGPVNMLTGNQSSHDEQHNLDELSHTESFVNQKGPCLSLQLLVCDSEFKGPSLNTLPFTKETFAKYMDDKKLPIDLLQFMITGTSVILRKVDENDGRTSFVMRLPIAKSENWSLGMSFDLSTGKTSAMLHGLQKHEFTLLSTELESIISTSIHPLHLPCVLCELLNEADSNGVKQLAVGLFQVEQKTIWHGYWQAGKESELLEDRPEHELESLTRTLNYIHKRLAFFEMRINANISFVSKLRLFVKSKDEPWATAIPEEEYNKLVRALNQRLDSLQAEHDALLTEVACNQKIANGQLQIVYNLIAQHDNKENLRMAETSTQIAAITKDDSFAMRTIAVMTIAFLPATAISSLFSMTMFNWQADANTSVVSNRFWIYWAVAVPLTLVVLALWFIWIQNHRTRENKLIPFSAAMPLSEGGTLMKSGRAVILRLKRLRTRASDPEKDESNNIQKERAANQTPKPEAQYLHQRVNTIAQGPMR